MIYASHFGSSRSCDIVLGEGVGVMCVHWDSEIRCYGLIKVVLGDT